MTRPWQDFLASIARIQREPRAERLSSLAAEVGLSPTHLQRAFRERLGESPKRLATRIALERAAAALVSTRSSVLEIALDSGFESHDGFTRAFRRHFGRTPSEYRRRGLEGAGASSAMASSHRELASHAAPCLGSYGRSLSEHARSARRQTMTYRVTRRDMREIRFLYVTKRVRRSEIAAALAELFPMVFGYATREGIPLASHPLCRYRDWSSSGVTLEAGVCVGAPAGGEGAILAGTLGPGPVIATVHRGPYDDLERAHAALCSWLEENGMEALGDPWEEYVTDPGEVPNPAEWETEVVQPIRPS